MTYENAPATQMLATFCACCGRPLVDSVSVETGIGPECRKRHAAAVAQAEPNWKAAREQLTSIAGAPELNEERGAQAAANVLVHRIACLQTGREVTALIAALHALGFSKLATRCATRVGAVRIEREGENLIVKTPFSFEFNEAVRSCRGQHFDRARKVRVVPVSERVTLWNVIQSSFPAGTIVIGERATVIEAA